MNEKQIDAGVEEIVSNLDEFLLPEIDKRIEAWFGRDLSATDDEWSAFVGHVSRKVLKSYFSK